MTVFYSDTYTVELPPGHRFPMGKYRLLRQALHSEGVLAPDELREAVPIDPESLVCAHTERYVASFVDGTIDAKAVRRIGIPWSRAFVRRSLASVGGTTAAARTAIREGIAGNIAGGTHHAFADHGEGYCVFNDIAVASLTLLGEGLVRRIAVIDLDVHQGNGTAAILGGDERILTFDMHARNNFPFTKIPASLDLPVEDGTGDREYLSLLAEALPRVLRFEPEIIFYQGGVDVLECDSLGRLTLTHAGVAERDRMVLAAAREREIPIVLTLGGGYARPIDRTVEAHVGTYRVAKEVFGATAFGDDRGSGRRIDVVE